MLRRGRWRGFPSPETQRVVEGIIGVCPRLTPGLEKARERQQDEKNLLMDLAGNSRAAGFLGRSERC